MKTFLTALGWVPDAPEGNRLRWHYPVHRPDGTGKFLGLPKRMIVERAPIDFRDLYHHRNSSAAYPAPWWQSHGNVGLTGAFPMLTYTLPKPAQAVSFTWSGSLARLLFIDADSGRAISEQTVNDTDQVYAEGTMIGAIVVPGAWGTLENFRTLDLFLDYGLNWKPIAELAVAETFQSPLSTVAPRYELPPTVSAARWQELTNLTQEAQAATPATVGAGTPTSWDNFAMVLGLRWEFALLGGFAFFDGPRAGGSQLDRVVGDLLQAPANVAMAYRVREAENRVAPSNVAVCPASFAAPLTPPQAVHYVAPEVRLRPQHEAAFLPVGGSITGTVRQFLPVTMFDGDYAVQTTMHWNLSDPRALGVEFDEIVSASAITGATATRREFASRTRDPQNGPMQGSLRRAFDVAFPDVTLQARARSIDGWDRVSLFSTWTSPTALTLHHQPLAPGFASGTHDGTTARLQRALGVPQVPDWEPDPFVERVAGRVNIYRQTSKPRTASVTFGLPVLVSDGVYQVTVTGASGLADFVGGAFSTGGFSEKIIGVAASTIQFRADKKSFIPGTGRLVQDPAHPTLWTKLADFPAVNLPVELVFSDPLPPSAGVAVEAYCARLSYFGRLGPPGNVVHALRHPTPLLTPPPFTVGFLGIDFYRRTLIRLQFTNPPGPGRFTIWWAGSIVNAAQLARTGAPGEYAAQETQAGSLLYDVLPLPIPRHVARTITVGVQRVSEPGVQSDFVTTPITIPPLGS